MLCDLKFNAIVAYTWSFIHKMQLQLYTMNVFDLQHACMAVCGMLCLFSMHPYDMYIYVAVHMHTMNILISCMHT